jgi:hypothetical protein
MTLKNGHLHVIVKALQMWLAISMDCSYQSFCFSLLAISMYRWRWLDAAKKDDDSPWILQNLFTIVNVLLTVNALQGSEMVVRYNFMSWMFYVVNGFSAQNSLNMHKNQRSAYVCCTVMTRIPVYSRRFLCSFGVDTTPRNTVVGHLELDFNE